MFWNPGQGVNFRVLSAEARHFGLASLRHSRMIPPPGASRHVEQVIASGLAPVRRRDGPSRRWCRRSARRCARRKAQPVRIGHSVPMSRWRSWRRIVQLDFWFGDEDAERYRMRRRRRTRVPLSWDDLIDVRLLPMGLAAFGTVVIGSIELLSRRGGWRATAGLALVAIGVAAISAVVRYLRLPVDPEFRSHPQGEE